MESKIDKIFDYIESDYFEGAVFGTSAYTYTEVEKGLRIAYLEGILEYSIWADHVPDGDKKYEALQDELNKLKNGK